MITHPRVTVHEGKKEVLWWNTNLDKPTAWDLVTYIEKEFPDIPFDKIRIESGIMSLAIIGPVIIDTPPTNAHL